MRAVQQIIISLVSVALVATADEVTGFVLIDADTDTPIAGFDPIANGATIDIAALPSANINIEALTDPATVGSVVFNLNGGDEQTENVAPYALAGDSSGDFNNWNYSLTSYTLTATPYSGSNGSGTPGTPLSISFWIVDTSDPGGGGVGGAVGAVLYLYGSVPPGDAGNMLRLNDTGGRGFSEFAATLSDLGFAPTEMLDASITLDAAALAPYDVLVLSSNNRPFSAAEQQAVVDWVNAGGGLLAYSDSQFGYDEGRASDNDILLHFNMFVHHDNFAGVFTIDTYTEQNYITDGITFKGEGVSLVRVLGPPARILAECQGGNCVLHPIDGPIQANDAALAIAEVGAGRVAVTFDRNTFFNPPGAGTNINEVDNREYLRRLAIWLRGLEPVDPNGEASGELKKWHNVTLTFSGPWTSEQAQPNPFTDYRLDVTFTHTDSGRSFVVPGYYAADGDAAETSASAGDRWRAHFRPDAEGEWTYAVSFRTGADVNISEDPLAGSPTGFDGASGSFVVGASDKAAPDFRARGLLEYVDERYLCFAETGEYFLKGGADSPENFLAYFEFDQTPTNKHRYEPHAGDYETGDPTWQGGKGQNIIGAINYLASEAMNSVYFLTMNVNGDGDDVWPWTSDDERFRYDCSKLDQWGIVFAHMESKGVMLHVLTQETENDQLLDGGALGPQRKLYYRELIARFGHHLAITWNLGEENTNTDAQRKQFATFFKTYDPYGHYVVVHTYPGQKEQVYAPLLGYPDFDGPSLQGGNNSVVREWIDRSANAGRPWVVCYDEQGPATAGVVPDADDFWHDSIRKNVLWGTLMAGGGGVEYYFGYSYPNDDLDCEDWRSRDNMWNLTRRALGFFHDYLPFWEMNHANGLTTASGDYVLAQPSEVYAVYLPNGGTTNLDLEDAPARFSIEWFDPRLGGALLAGGATEATGPGVVALGDPPAGYDPQDWAVLIRRVSLLPSELDTFLLCLAGPNVTVPPAGCDPVDFGRADEDGDLDSDLADFAAYQARQ